MLGCVDLLPTGCPRIAALQAILELLPSRRSDLACLLVMAFLSEQVMAAALNVTVTEHAFGDTSLILEGQKLGLPVGTVNLEFRLFERLFGLTLPEAKALLRLFADMDVQKRCATCPFWALRPGLAKQRCPHDRA